VTTLALTINGRAHGPVKVLDELTMNDFLREFLGLTGTKFGGGAAQCLVARSSSTTPTGRASPARPASFRRSASTARRSALSKVMPKTAICRRCKRAPSRILHFQCGYCTPGFLNEGQVLLERLAKKPVAHADLEKTIAQALDGHLCRCTGYVRYHEAVRDVILADPTRYLT
jgi:aerobic-type carbon monoxide dehydrogenase small subunit (CoxS/CutS family)